MISKFASQNTNTPPKFELIAGGLASQSTNKPEVSASALRTQGLNAEHAQISPEEVQEVITKLIKVMQGSERLLTSMEENQSTFGMLVERVSEKAREIALKEQSLNVAMQTLAQYQPAFVTIDDQLHLVVSPLKLTECVSLLAKTLKLPCFFSPGIGLVEVEEEPLFGGWRCSPVPVTELVKALRAKVHLHCLQSLSEGQSAGEVDLYDCFAGELAGESAFNSYFPELKGEVFVGHKMSDGRVLKRSGYDKRSGLFVRSHKPFHAANDETLAVAA